MPLDHRHPRNASRTAVVVGAVAAALTIGSGVASSRRAAAKAASRKVATVNGVAITRAQLDQRMRWISKRLRGKKLSATRRSEIRRKVLRQLIDEALVEQRARALKISVSEADVDHAIKRVLKRSGLSKTELVLRLRREGKTMPIYRRLLRRMVREGKVLHRVLGKRHLPSEAELRAAHKRDPSLSRFPYARVRRVLRQQIMGRRIGKARAAWLRGLRAKARIRIIGAAKKRAKSK